MIKMNVKIAVISEIICKIQTLRIIFKTKLILINHMMTKDPILLILKVRSVERLQGILINVRKKMVVKLIIFRVMMKNYEEINVFKVSFWNLINIILFDIFIYLL